MRQTYKITRTWQPAALVFFMPCAVIAEAPESVHPMIIKVPEGSKVAALKYSPDGKQLAVFCSDLVTAGQHAQIFDVTTHNKVCDLVSPTAPPYAFMSIGRDEFRGPCWSSDGSRIAVHYHDSTHGTLHLKSGLTSRMNYISKFAIWDSSTGKLQVDALYALLDEESFNGPLHFSSDSQTLIGDSLPPSIFNASTGERLRKVQGSFDNPATAELNEGLGLLAVGTEFGQRFEVFDTQAKRAIWEPTPHRVQTFQWCGDVLGVTAWFDPKGSKTQLLLWDGRARKPLPFSPVLSFPQIGIPSFNPDRVNVAFFNFESAAGDIFQRQKLEGELVVWDYRQNRQLWNYPSKTRLFWVQWSPDGKWLSAISDYIPNSPYRLLIFNRSGQLKAEKEVSSEVTAWSPDSRYLATVTKSENNSRDVEILAIGE